MSSIQSKLIQSKIFTKIIDNESIIFDSLSDFKYKLNTEIINNFSEKIYTKFESENKLSDILIKYIDYLIKDRILINELQNTNDIITIGLFSIMDHSIITSRVYNYFNNIDHDLNIYIKDGLLEITFNKDKIISHMKLNFKVNK